MPAGPLVSSAMATEQNRNTAQAASAVRARATRVIHLSLANGNSQRRQLRLGVADPHQPPQEVDALGPQLLRAGTTPCTGVQLIVDGGEAQLQLRERAGGIGIDDPPCRRRVA